MPNLMIWLNRRWMSNYSPPLYVDVITFPCRDHDADLANLCELKQPQMGKLNLFFVIFLAFSWKKFLSIPCYSINIRSGERFLEISSSILNDVICYFFVYKTCDIQGTR